MFHEILAAYLKHIIKKMQFFCNIKFNLLFLISISVHKLITELSTCYALLHSFYILVEIK